MKNDQLRESFFLKFKTPVIYLIILIFGIGFFFYSKINISLFPEITFPKIKIIAENGEQPVDKMMVTVTKPLEEAIKQIPDLKTVKSITSRGSCEISAFLDWKADINISQQQLESRISQIRNELPSTTTITIEQMNPSVLPVMGFILESKNMDLIELKMLAKYTVKPFLEQIEGISKIQIQGGKEKEYWVELKPDNMLALRITPAVVRDAFAKTNFINSNGLITDYRRLYLSLTDAQVYDKSDIEKIVVQNDGKRAVTLKDIADISVNEKIEYVNINVDGHEGVLVNVIKQPNTNLILVSESIREKTKELEKLLPKGVSLKLYYDQADFVNESIRSVSDALWIGLLFALVVTFVFLRSFKASITVLFTIPATIGLTMILLYIFDYTFNLMTFGAIAASVGLIIDDAIVVLEQIHRIREEVPDEKPSVIVKKSIQYLLPAMIGSSMSTIVIFLPFSFMSGVAGAYFKVLAYTMIITLVSSFFITWVALPVIYLLFHNHRDSKTRAPHVVKDNKFLKYFLSNPVYSIIFVVALILLSLIIIPRLSSGFLPEMDEGTIVLDYSSPPGTSLDETNEILNKVDKIVASTPEVDHYSRRIGSQLGFFITEPNSGDYLIQLKKDRTKTTDEVIDEIRKNIEGVQLPLVVDFGQVINDMLGDLMSSVQPIEIKIFGDNTDLLKKYSEQVAEAIGNVEGTADVFNGITIAGPTIEYNPDQNMISRFNLNPEDIQFQLQNLIVGNVIGNILEKEQLTDIRLFSTKLKNKDMNEIANSYIYLPDGTTMQLRDLVKVNIKTGVAEIDRENLKTLAKVTGRLNKRDLGSVVTDIKNKINSKIFLPQGFAISYGGAYAEQQQSFKELLIILATAGLLVLSVLLILFRDLKGSIIILFISMLGLSGSFLALFITDIPLNVGSYTGVIMIVGIIAENATFTFHQFKMLLNTYSVNDAVLKAISIRLRPNLMTALGAIIALMPLALALGSGAQLHQPLAIAVTGGFIIGLPILVFVFPVLLKFSYRNLE
ncbi:MAG TPA: efflux RND transporter permease subunit [Ignavibacteria bacterium]